MTSNKKPIMPIELDDTQPEETEIPVEETALDSEIELLKAEIEKLKNDKVAAHDQLLRISADHDNFRKRTLKEKADFAKYANEKIICDLLPVLDSFEHAMIHLKDDAEITTLKKGIELIYNEFKSTLAKFGVVKIDAQGKQFDPNYHEAMMPVSSLEHEDNEVVEDLRPGYLLNERLIRPSMVKVNRRPPESSTIEVDVTHEDVIDET